MGSIEEALRTAGAEDDLQTILLVLEDKSGGFKRHEAAAGPFANMDTMLLTGLNTCLAPSRGRSSSSSNIKSLLAASCCWRAIPSLLLLRSANASS
ncbi:hypothetical protein ABBQ32_012999 [Trebouxia sp. C0010 RCD-2024]